MRRRQALGRWLSGLAGIIATGVILTGCAAEEPPPPPPSDPELRATLGIADDVTIHRIDLSGEAPRLQPDSLVVLPGDVVQIVVLDHQAHLLRFQEDRMAPALLDFLRDTAQDRPPPLVDQGARLVLSFQDAPVGNYRFQVEGNGDPATGRIRVISP